jgi:hypothetical protein
MVLVVMNRDIDHVVLKTLVAVQSLMFCHQDVHLIQFIAGGLMLLEKEFLMGKALQDQGS